MNRRDGNNYKRILFILWCVAFLWISLGCGGDSNNPPSPALYSNATLTGTWISKAVPLEKSAYWIFDGNGTITEFGAIFASSPSGTYQVQQSGAFTGMLNFLYVPSTPFSGTLSSVTYAVLSSGGELMKVSDLGACQGYWSGSLTETVGGSATYPISFTVSESGNITSFTGLGYPVSGKVFSELGNIVAHFATTSTGYNEFRIYGDLSGSTASGSFKASGLSTNITGSFSLTKTAPPDFTNASLNDTYSVMMPMISTSSTTVSYAEIAGPAVFNGTGSVTITGTARVVDVGLTSSLSTTTEPSTMAYSVASAGSFTMTDPSNQTLTGQIVLSGNAILLDGTGRTDPTELIGKMVGMKRVAGPTPTYSNASLNGAYLFVTSEVYSSGTPTFCEQAGTLTFDGSGSVTVSGTSRCSDGSALTSAPQSETIEYSVDTDGSFTIGAAATKQLHGQIVMDGSSLLLDGTMQGNSDQDYLFNGVAMKRVASGSPPTYSNTSLNGSYLFIVTEATTASFCDQAGTLTFDGSGSVTVSGTSRCSDGTNVTSDPMSGTLAYSVSADGSFTLTDPGDQSGEAFHGQIALNGNSMLLDATMRLSAGTLLNSGVAMKR